MKHYFVPAIVAVLLSSAGPSFAVDQNDIDLATRNAEYARQLHREALAKHREAWANYQRALLEAKQAALEAKAAKDRREATEKPSKPSK